MYSRRGREDASQRYAKIMERPMVSETLTHNCHSGRTNGGERPVGSVWTVMVTLMKRLRDRHEAWRLFAMSDQDLKDIGITRGDVYREATKPLWSEAALEVE
jgi:uncharacterized protein YjiS (DUF1127 family)